MSRLSVKRAAYKYRIAFRWIQSNHPGIATAIEKEASKRYAYPNPKHTLGGTAPTKKITNAAGRVK